MRTIFSAPTPEPAPARAFFGYGSLVNAATHGFDAPAPATLTGWRRAWRHTRHRPVSFLTAVPAGPEDALLGLVARVPDGDWAELDAREYAYERVMVTQSTRPHAGPAPEAVAVYAIAPGAHAAPRADHPVLQSYLDTVLQGYLRVFGPPGVAHFIDTTDGWAEAPVLQDREAPRYPRATALGEEERDLIDAALDGVIRRQTL
jgi:hypothetical protein